MHVIDLNVNKKQVLKILCVEYVPCNSEGLRSPTPHLSLRGAGWRVKVSGCDQSELVTSNAGL